MPFNPMLRDPPGCAHAFRDPPLLLYTSHEAVCEEKNEVFRYKESHSRPAAMTTTETKRNKESKTPDKGQMAQRHAQFH